MSRNNAPNARVYQRGESFRVDKRAKLKSKKGRGPDAWSKKGASGAKDAATGITSLKRRLRSLSRLLCNNGKLPADVKLGHEREVQALQHELVGLLLDKEKHEMIGKYHKVRFFERQRATRNLRKATKALEACEEAAEDGHVLHRRVHVAQVDVNYPQYYPYMTVYQSLWKREKDEDGNEHYAANGEQKDGAKGNIEIWRQVEAAMADGTLEKLKDVVDESKMEKLRRTVASFGSASASSVKTKNGQNIEDDEDREDETGTGFFE